MRFFLICFLLIGLSASAQNFEDNWTGHFSYNHIVAVSQSSEEVFAAASNSVFSYNLATGERTKLSSIQGLAGEDISALTYVESYNLLFIGYENGLIQVYNTAENSVFTFIDITEKQTITPTNKTINQFFRYQDRLLVSTDYGISEIDLDALEFGDTFFIGAAGEKLTVNQTTVFNGIIYAATQSQGVRFAPVDSDELVDFQTWQRLGGNSYRGIVVYENTLYAMTSGGTLQQFQNGNFISLQQFNGEVRDIQTSQDFLTVTQSTSVTVLNPSGNAVGIVNDILPVRNFSSSLVVGQRLFIGDRQAGLLSTNIVGTAAVQSLSPNGPLRNSVFALDNIQDNVWCVYGETNFFYNPYPLNSFGVSHLQGNQWVNIPFEDIQARSIVDVEINPRQPNQVFLSSYFNGLIEIQDNEVVNTYNVNTTNLTGTELATNPNDVRIGPSAFDREQNLWVTQGLNSTGLLRLPMAGDNFEKIDVTGIIPDAGSRNNGFGDIVIDQVGNIYTGTYADGVVGYNPSSGSFGKVSGGDEDGNLPDDYVLSLALDNNQQLWIGTVRGLRVLYGPTQMFDNPSLSADPIIILDNDGVAQELLSNITISDIEVDGNNNKWIATSAGVYYLSEDGQETLARFTVDNSPLPTNVVTDIGIDDESGTVYIGTARGLLAYRGRVTGARDNLDNVRAFPNPVRPHYSGMVTIDGLMEDANVKITDVTGNLVYEEFSQGGSIQWDTRAFGKHKVASGVYFVIITSDDATETKVAKIMIIR